MIFNNNQIVKGVIIALLVIVPIRGMSEYVPGIVLVRLKRGIVELPKDQTEGNIEAIKGDQNLKSYLTNAGLTKIEKVFPRFNTEDTLVQLEDGEIVKVQDLSLIFKFSFDPNTNIEIIIDSLKQYSNVIYAEPDYLGTLLFIPDDDSFSKQWALKQDNDCDIDAELAWNIETGNSGIKIGILDNGVNYWNADLGIGFGPGYKVRGGWDFVDNDPDPKPPLVDHHGTHVAGIASALTHNDIGVAGLSGGTGGSDMGCQLFAFRMPNNQSTVANVIMEAADPEGGGWGYGNHVLNLSWGWDSYVEVLREAVSYAYKCGRTFCASKGNSGNIGNPPNYPSDFDGHWVISVGATNRNDLKTDWSSYGRGMDVVAPGESILSTFSVLHAGDELYGRLDGTSMSSPLVAGLASLILSRALEKGISLQPEDVEGIIRATAYDPPWSEPGYDDLYGAGRINAYDALRYFDYPQSIRRYTVTPTSGITVGFYTRQLVGIPGLPDGTYYVMVNEYRSDFDLPSDTIKFLGIWGLGRLTTGYSNASPNYGEGYCAVEKLPNGKYRAKTYVYLVMEPNPPHQTIGWFPLNPYQNNVLLTYSVFSLIVVAPYNLRAENITQTSLTLRWNYDYPTLIDGYTVKRDGAVIANLPPNQLELQEAGLEPGHLYYYEVYARKGNVYSSPATLYAGTVPTGAIAQSNYSKMSAFNNSAKVARYGNNVYAVYRKQTQINYLKSTDGGANFGPEQNIAESDYLTNPAICLSTNGTPYIVWGQYTRISGRGGPQDPGWHLQYYVKWYTTGWNSRLIYDEILDDNPNNPPPDTFYYLVPPSFTVSADSGYVVFLKHCPNYSRVIRFSLANPGYSYEMPFIEIPYGVLLR